MIWLEGKCTGRDILQFDFDCVVLGVFHPWCVLIFEVCVPYFDLTQSIYQLPHKFKSDGEQGVECIQHRICTC